MYRRWSIKTKLIVLVSIPLFGFFLFGGIVIYEDVNTFLGANKTAKQTQLAIHASQLIHELQKERGMTAGFLGSRGEKFVKALPNQRELSNQNINALQAYHEGFPANRLEAELLQNSFEKIQLIEETREKIDRLDIVIPEAVTTYSGIIRSLFNLVGQISRSNQDSSIANMINSYLKLMEAKEQAGLERAALSNMFAQGSFEDNGFHRWATLVATEGLFLKQFQDSALQTHAGSLETKLESEAIEKFLEIRQIVGENHFAYDNDPEEWFQAASYRIDVLKTVENEIATELLQRALNVEKYSLTLLMGIVVLFTALLLCIGIFLSRFLKNTVTTLTSVKDALHGFTQGEFDQRVEIMSQDELGNMAHQLNQYADHLQANVLENLDSIAQGDLTQEIRLSSVEDMLGMTLQKMLKQLNATVGQIAVAASELSLSAKNLLRTSEEISEGATTQAASIEEIAASIQNLADGTQQNAKNAQQADTLVKTSKEQVQQGNQSMQSLLGAMSEIQNSSQKISHIIKTIDEIAFQTNLLAINAAVEAARAGDAGKGFSVVAEEVRNLAANSARAAKETTEMIESSMSKVEEGIQIAHQTASALESMVGSIVQVTELINEISQASNDQALGITQINQGLEQINQVTQTNASHATANASFSEKIASQADGLHNQISRFKTKTSPSKKTNDSNALVVRDTKLTPYHSF